jgi:ArsR family transcriptional regulator, arsenate/arsenite/antimonite-responsive transcriptional repressor
MVTAMRDQNWMIYSLPKKRSRELEKNLKCLQDCVQSDHIFARDLTKLAQLRENCCEPAALFATRKAA